MLGHNKQYPLGDRLVETDEQIISVPCNWYLGSVFGDQTATPALSTRLSVGFQVAISRIQAAVRDFAGRERIKVAILDTGIDVDHPAFAGNINRERKNFTGGAERDVKDEVGHGTMVAGLIAAHGPATSVTGVAPNADLFIGKVVRQEKGPLEALEAGIQWAIDQRVDVINISLGDPHPMPKIQRKISDAFGQGIFVVCAAGNRGEAIGVEFPAQYEQCIAVGALAGQGNRWENNNQVGSAIGDELDIMAPGDGVRSTFPRYLDHRGEAASEGTSLAAPIITGAVALAWEKLHARGEQTNNANLQMLRRQLLRTAIDLPRNAPNGKDKLFGNGKIDQESFLRSLDQ